MKHGHRKKKRKLHFKTPLYLYLIQDLPLYKILTYLSAPQLLAPPPTIATFFPFF